MKRGLLWAAAVLLWAFCAWRLWESAALLPGALLPEFDRATQARVDRAFGGAAVFASVFLPNLLSAVVIRALGWDVDGEARGSTFLLSSCWRLAVTFALVAALLHDPLLFALEAASKPAACALLAVLALVLSTFECVLCWAPVTLARSSVRWHEEAWLGQAVGVLLSAVWFLPTAAGVALMLPGLQMGMLAQLQAGARSTVETREAMLLIHEAALTVLGPGLVLWPKGREKALEFLDWNLSFVNVRLVGRGTSAR